jgi:hypothetical protein
VVPGPTRTASASRISVAIPVRDGDSTAWLPQPEIQRLLAAGWTATGGPSEELLADLIQQAVSAARRDRPPAPGPALPVPGPAFRVGDGEPGWQRAFQQAWNELKTDPSWAGDPVTEVYLDGPGVVQELESRPDGNRWVLCALPQQTAVAVADDVWRGLQAAGSGAPGGDALGATGFPAPSSLATRKIGIQAPDVQLTGGRWGEGRLLRHSENQEWRWEPVARLSMSITRSARNWTASQAR